MFIERTNGTRRLVISDIHGCLKTFQELIGKVAPAKNDQIFILGDYIDRGPASSGVLDFLLQMKSAGFTLYLLKGNHEVNLLNAYSEYDKETFIFFVRKINKSLSLLNQDGDIKKEYYDFFNSLNWYFETDTHLIVHAGINFNCDDPFTDTVSMVELRHTDIEKAQRFIGNKAVIHGHQVTPIDEITAAVRDRKQVIPLDNGCYYTKKHKVYDVNTTGNLCCFDLDSYELYLQRNIEVE